MPEETAEHCEGSYTIPARVDTSKRVGTCSYCWDWIPYTVMPDAEWRLTPWSYYKLVSHNDEAAVRTRRKIAQKIAEKKANGHCFGCGLDDYMCACTGEAE
jgi:hypothetical protein